MNDKAIVCACEDVTAAELEDAVGQGYGDVESMKRYTGLGTGPCQGKSCLVAAMRFCADSRRSNVAVLLAGVPPRDIACFAPWRRARSIRGESPSSRRR